MVGKAYFCCFPAIIRLAPLNATSGLTSYIATKGYLDFAAANKTVGNGVGFWTHALRLQ